MENSPELSGKYLGMISKDFVKAAELLKESSYQIRVRNISDFPIFPVCRNITEIGAPLIEKQNIDSQWNFNISYLDEFVQRTIIGEEGIEAFKNVYKDPDEFCCLFVIDYDFTNFLFIPYPEDIV